MAVTKIKPIKSTLKKALDYIQNPDKTDGKMLVSSFGCSYLLSRGKSIMRKPMKSENSLPTR